MQFNVYYCQCCLVRDSAVGEKRKNKKMEGREKKKGNEGDERVRLKDEKQEG